MIGLLPGRSTAPSSRAFSTGPAAASAAATAPVYSRNGTESDEIAGFTGPFDRRPSEPESVRVRFTD